MKTQTFPDASEFAIFHQNCDKSWLDPITQRAKFLFATGLKIDAKRFFWQFINISRSLAALQKKTIGRQTSAVTITKMFQFFSSFPAFSVTNHLHN